MEALLEAFALEPALRWGIHALGNALLLAAAKCPASPPVPACPACPACPGCPGCPGASEVPAPRERGFELLFWGLLVLVAAAGFVSGRITGRHGRAGVAEVGVRAVQHGRSQQALAPTIGAGSLGMLGG